MQSRKRGATPTDPTKDVEKSEKLLERRDLGDLAIRISETPGRGDSQI